MLGQHFVLNVPEQYGFVVAAMAAAVVPVAFAAFKDVSIDRFVGDLSYPIYLVHFPVIQFLSSNYVVVVAISLLVCLVSSSLVLRGHWIAFAIASPAKNRAKKQPIPAITAEPAFELANTADQKS